MFTDFFGRVLIDSTLLSTFHQEDLELARYTCVALQRLNGSVKKVKGSLQDNTVRYPMDTQIFTKLEKAVERPCRQRDWFGLAEQAINTVYALGEHPDVWCEGLIKKLTKRAFGPKEKNGEDEADKIEEDKEEGGENPKEDESEGSGEKGSDEDEDGDVSMSQADTTFTQQPSQTQSTQSDEGKSKDVGDAFELSQLLFVVGHVAIKQIVFLELVEREWKRQKDEKLAGNVVLSITFVPRLIKTPQLISKQLPATSPSKTKKERNWTKLLETQKTKLETEFRR